MFDSRGAPQTGVAQSDDMQVDMVKGKGKKGKQNGKDKGSPKGATKGKFGKAKFVGKKGASGTTERFEGYCSGCNKWGHKRAHCWTNPPVRKPDKQTVVIAPSSTFATDAAKVQQVAGTGERETADVETSWYWVLPHVSVPSRKGLGEDLW